MDKDRKNDQCIDILCTANPSSHQKNRHAQYQDGYSRSVIRHHPLDELLFSCFKGSDLPFFWGLKILQLAILELRSSHANLHRKWGWSNLNVVIQIKTSAILGACLLCRYGDVFLLLGRFNRWSLIGNWQHSWLKRSQNYLYQILAFPPNIHHEPNIESFKESSAFNLKWSLLISYMVNHVWEVPPVLIVQIDVNQNSWTPKQIDWTFVELIRFDPFAWLDASAQAMLSWKSWRSDLWVVTS